MTKIPTAEQFLDSIAGVSRAAAGPTERHTYAIVDPDYAGGPVHLIFDGETTLTARTFPILHPRYWSPLPGAKVLVLEDAHGAVILGEVGDAV